MRLLPLLLVILGCKKTPPAPPVAATGDCDRPEGMFGPVVIADRSQRYGANITALASAQTSKAQPIEVCGVPEQLQWLTSARCADGSVPFSSPGDAHAARSGSVGEGGRCGSIIDLYLVPCPEETYNVFMDLYVCAPGQSLY